MVLKATVQKQNSKQSLLEVSLKKTVQKPNSELWTVISYQMIKYQLPHMRFNRISDNKHDIYLNEKLSTKLLALAGNKNTMFMFTKTGRLLFFEVWFQKKLCRKILNKQFRRLKR